MLIQDICDFDICDFIDSRIAEYCAVKNTLLNRIIIEYEPDNGAEAGNSINRTYNGKLMVVAGNRSIYMYGVTDGAQLYGFSINNVSYFCEDGNFICGSIILVNTDIVIKNVKHTIKHNLVVAFMKAHVSEVFNIFNNRTFEKHNNGPRQLTVKFNNLTYSVTTNIKTHAVVNILQDISLGAFIIIFNILNGTKIDIIKHINYDIAEEITRILYYIGARIL